MTSIVIASLACWRITYMLVKEEGPWEIFRRLRKRIDHTEWSPLHCAHCTSMWVAIVIGVLMSLSILEILAVSAITILFNEVIRWLVTAQK